MTTSEERSRIPTTFERHIHDNRDRIIWDYAAKVLAEETERARHHLDTMAGEETER